MASKDSSGVSTINTECSNGKKPKKLWIFAAGILLIALIAGVLVVPQVSVSPLNSNESLQLGINYTVGERMVYNSTGGWIDTIDILGFDGQNYAYHMNSSGQYPKSEGYYSNPTNIPAPTIVKTDYYKNFLPEGQPSIFNDAANDPVLASYLEKTSVNIGDVWAIPVWGGEVNLKFSGIQKTTVPSGTYRTFEIKISSHNLTIETDLSADGIKYANYQINGTTYLEQGTCRLIKFNLTEQQTTFYSNGTNNTLTIQRERLLISHNLPEQ